MVPNGWEQGCVEDLLQGLESGVSVNGVERPLMDGELGVLKVSAVSYGVFNRKAIKVIELPKEQQRAKVHPKKGQIIISRSNTEELVGASAYIEDDFDHLYLPDKLWQTVPKPNSDMKWLSYVLSSEHSRYTLSNLATGTSGSMKNITKGELLGLKIGIPPITEQRKIAKILGTWDKTISTTERLIDNSKQQKKALMQQLLTGKKRLLNDSGKPFKGEWKEVNLGEISSITTGSSNREDSSLDAQYAFFDRSEDIRTSSRYLFDTEAVIVAGEGQDFVPKYFKGKFDLHQRTYAIMNFDGCVGRFMFYYIGYFRYYFLAQAVGSTVKSLRLPMFQKMPIKMPSELEQQKITSVLTNAEQEIDLLGKQLADLKQEKKALMQKLLTGKRRVKT